MDRHVALTRAADSAYTQLPAPISAPELPEQTISTIAGAALRSLFQSWRLDEENFGTPQWCPFRQFIAPNSVVVVKPNLVSHYNQSGAGLECLITHPSLIEAVVQYVALCRPGRIIVGDAPLQSCDFETLRRLSGLDASLDRIRRSGICVELIDFRRTILHLELSKQHRQEEARPTDRFILFDLASDSLLEAVSQDAARFRVTRYNPDLMPTRHGRGRHQYLIAREVLEAETVINLPKLKTHKKACITGALKNMVGINGNKEFLTHHRKGGSGNGGDCYAGSSWFKGKAEDLLDGANRLRSEEWKSVAFRGAEILTKLAAWCGENRDLEGSWHGNDTVWRMCLDLQRILHYGGLDAKLSSRPRRNVISICDAIVGGEGEGPLANTPVPSRFLSGGTSTAAVEWINARLMGLDPEKIPLVRHAFEPFRYPLADFSPQQIEVRDSARTSVRKAADVVPFDGRHFLVPNGWQGACELLPPRPHDAALV